MPSDNKTVRVCKYHGETEFFRFKRTVSKRTGEMLYYWKCIECRKAHQRVTRRDRKKRLVEAFGGKCQRCGYEKCLWALHFHHRDKEQKEFHVSNLSFEKALIEAKKCDLLCANCHYETETIHKRGEVGYE